jgi:hypothetical protein
MNTPSFFRPDPLDTRKAWGKKREDEFAHALPSCSNALHDEAENSFPTHLPPSSPRGDERYPPSFEKAQKVSILPEIRHISFLIPFRRRSIHSIDNKLKTNTHFRLVFFFNIGVLFWIGVLFDYHSTSTAPLPIIFIASYLPETELATESESNRKIVGERK